LIAEEQSHELVVFRWIFGKSGAQTWIQKILLKILNTEMERAGCMDHSLKRWIRNDFLVKGWRSYTVQRLVHVGHSNRKRVGQGA
jgi:hypothetical protein